MIRRILFCAAVLALASCNSDQDNIDNLAAAEGVARNEPVPEVEPEPLPPPVVNLPAEPPEANLEVPPEAAPPVARDELAPTPAPPVTSARPSFDCSGDLNRVEAMICSNPELARIDRQVANTYFRATRRADPDQAERLERIGRRYLADRNRCPTDYCVRQAYRWYLRDIEGIMGTPGN